MKLKAIIKNKLNHQHTQEYYRWDVVWGVR